MSFLQPNPVALATARDTGSEDISGSSKLSILLDVSSIVPFASYLAATNPSLPHWTPIFNRVPPPTPSYPPSLCASAPSSS